MSGNLPRWKSREQMSQRDDSSQCSDSYSNKGNQPRWKSRDQMPKFSQRDDASQCSDACSDISALDEYARSSEVVRRLHSLFTEQLYTDVKFVINCGIKPKPTLQAHKAILAVGSTKFKEMLYDGMSTSGKDEFQINNISYEAFKNIVEFLYTDDIFFENDKSVMDTLSAAVMFQIDSLVEKCETHIASMEITEDNVCTKLQVALNSKMASLKSRCIDFIQEYTGSVLRSNDFLSVNPTTVRTICKLEKLNLRSEVELLNAVIRYIEGRPESKANKRAAIEPYLKHLRLMNLSSEEFNQFVQQNPTVFSAPEAATILVSLANPGNPSANLPSWCKRGSNRCNYHIQPGLERPVRRQRFGYGNICHKVPIMLKSSKVKQNLSNLVCFLELKCLRGYHRIEGLKLSFDDPIQEKSMIGDLSIIVNTEFPRYQFEERLQIEQSKDVELRFSKALFAHRGKIVTIRAFANEIKNYKFLQFDENNTFPGDSCFECTLGSVPKENKFFCISEVLYRDGPPPRAPRGPPRKFIGKRNEKTKLP